MNILEPYAQERWQEKSATVRVPMLRNTDVSRGMHMLDGKANSIRIMALYGLFAAALMFMIVENYGDPWPATVLSGLFLLSFTFRNAVVSSLYKNARLKKLALVADVFLVLWIDRFDRGIGSVVLYFILVAEASFADSVRFGRGIMALALACFVAVRMSTQGTSLRAYGFSETAFYMLAFLAAHAIPYLVRRESKHKEELSASMYDLKRKTKLLENAYRGLKESTSALEEMAALQERHEIAREIHDTVGHTLTSILFEMEAGERLIRYDPDRAVRKIAMAKSQARNGLADIRKSVTALQSERETYEWIPAIRSLVEQTAQNGEIFIKHEIEEIPQLTMRQGKALYRALQEGLTNGIKHGRSTAFVFKLKYEDKRIRFFLQDNGVGTESITMGFGLVSMEERVKQAGGALNLSAQPGQGFTIFFDLPHDPQRNELERQRAEGAHEEHQRTHCR